MRDQLTARVSAKGQIAIPKSVRDRLGIVQGADMSVRVKGKDVILRKAASVSWQRWEGRFKGSPLLKDLVTERRREIIGGAEPLLTVALLRRFQNKRRRQPGSGGESR